MRRTRGGYTIIEVLVVLAVGVVIFFAAVALFAGKQGKTQFSQAMRDVESEMQSVVNEVGVSLFPNSDQYTCTVVSGLPNLSSGGKTGSNQDCVFLGKAIKVDTVSNPQQLLVYTVLGTRLDASGNIVGTIDADKITDARPKPFTVNTADGDPDLTDIYAIPGGMTVVSSKTDLDKTPNAETYLVGFYNGQQSNAQQGSLSLLALGYTGIKANSPDNQIINSIEKNAPKAGEVIKNWTLCLQSGTSDEMAKLVVSTSSAGISTSIVYGDCS